MIRLPSIPIPSRYISLAFSRNIILHHHKPSFAESFNHRNFDFVHLQGRRAPCDGGFECSALWSKSLILQDCKVRRSTGLGTPCTIDLIVRWRRYGLSHLLYHTTISSSFLYLCISLSEDMVFTSVRLTAIRSRRASSWHVQRCCIWNRRLPSFFLPSLFHHTHAYPILQSNTPRYTPHTPKKRPKKELANTEKQKQSRSHGCYLTYLWCFSLDSPPLSINLLYKARSNQMRMQTIRR